MTRPVPVRWIVGACATSLLVGLVVVVLVLPPTWRDEDRYGETHDDSLRGMLGASDVAALAEVVSGDGRFDGGVATYRVVRPLVGLITAGDTLQVAGPGRLPYLGRDDFALFGDGNYTARPGTRVFLFLRRTEASPSHVPVAPSGVLAVDQLVSWMVQPPTGIEEAILPRFVDLATILRLLTSPERNSHEAELILDALGDPLTAGRAADDLILNWRSRPPLDEQRPWPKDASDLRARLTPSQERRLMDALGNRRLLQAVRADMAWLLADVEDPRIDELLRAELADELAVRAHERETPGVAHKEPAATFPGDQFPGLNIFWARPFLAVMARRAKEPRLHALLQEYVDTPQFDENQVRVARRFLQIWDE